MQALLEQTVLLLSEPPGSFVYHLLTLFVLEMALVFGLRHAWRERNWPAARLVVATLIPSLLALTLLVVALLAAIGILDGPRILPVLDRAALTLTFLFTLWIAAFPKANRIVDGLAFGLGVIGLIGFGVGWAIWLQLDPQSVFNGSPLETVWEGAKLGLIGACVVALVWQRRADWGLGLLIALLLLAGVLLHFAVTFPFHPFIAGAERLLELLAWPLFAALAYRRAHPVDKQPTLEQWSTVQTVVPQARPLTPLTPLPPTQALGVDPKAAVALASLGATANPAEIAQIATLALAHTTRADLVILLASPDNNYCQVLNAYELGADYLTARQPLPLEALPEIKRIFETREARTLSPERNGAELRRLSGAFGLTAAGPTLAVPILPIDVDGPPVAMIVLANTKSKRLWAADDQLLLRALAEPLAEALTREARGLATHKQMTEQVAAAHTRAETAEDEHRLVEAANDRLTTELEDTRLEAKRLAEEIKQLRTAQLQALAPAVVDESEAMDDMRAKLQAAQQQMEALTAQVRTDLEAEWQAKLIDAQQAANTALFTVAAQTAELEQLRKKATGALSPTDVAQLKSELDHAYGALNAARQQIDSLQTELGHLRELADDRPTEPTPLDATQQQVISLQAEVARLREQANDYGGTLIAFNAAKQQIDSLQTELARLRDQADDQTDQSSEIELLTLQLATTREALLASQHRVETLTHDLERLRTDLATTAAAALTAAEQVREIERLHRALEEAHDRLVDIETAQDVAVYEADLRKGLVTADTELRARIAELERLRDTLRDRERELSDANKALSELAGQTYTLISTQKHLIETEKQLASTEAQLADMTERVKKFSGLKTQLDERDQQLVETRAALVLAQSGQTTETDRPFLPQDSLDVIVSLTQELRQPLSSIVGYTDLLLGESVGIIGALQRKFLERIKASNERIEVLLNDLIRVTDIDAGGLELIRRTVNVKELVDEAVKNSDSQLRDKNLQLRLDLKEPLPDIEADLDALRQIFNHLLSNAISASRNDSTINLTVRGEGQSVHNGNAQDEFLFISVKDTGGGIAREDQSRVFSRIYRANMALISGLGDTGIGLSVTKALVEAHGGRIWMTSEAGEGSTFSALLPIYDRATSAPSSALASLLSE